MVVLCHFLYEIFYLDHFATNVQRVHLDTVLTAASGLEISSHLFSLRTYFAKTNNKKVNPENHKHFCCFTTRKLCTRV